MKRDLNKMVRMAMLSALAVILMLLVRIPIIPSAAFLEYDPGDVPALIGTFIYGPAAGFAITVTYSVIQTLIASKSGWIGTIMHIIATGTMVIAAGYIYKKLHFFKGALIALIAGSVCMTLIMIPLNLYITPRFLNIPYDAVKGMLLPAIIPFNLLKAIINSVLTLIVYKPVTRFLRSRDGKDLGNSI